MLWKYTWTSQGNLLSIGTPFNNQLILGLGMPLALQIRVPSSPGDSTRFWGAIIQYGAALLRKRKKPKIKNKEQKLDFSMQASATSRVLGLHRVSVATFNNQQRHQPIRKILHISHTRAVHCTAMGLAISENASCISFPVLVICPYFRCDLNVL